MKKNLICALLTVTALCAALSGCSMTGESEATEQPAAAPSPIIFVSDEYALLEGHTLYQSTDNGFSIQLPEGCEVSGDDPANVSVTLKSEFATPDTISITKSSDTQAVDSVEGLLEMLKDDNSIDITAFYVLKKGEAYEGYKYTYTSVDDPQLKGIKCCYFTTDGSAYTVNASIYNGGDDANVESINTIVDTFISYL